MTTAPARITMAGCLLRTPDSYTRVTSWDSQQLHGIALTDFLIGPRTCEEPATLPHDSLPAASPGGMVEL